MNIGKNAFTLTVLLEIDFNKMGKQFLTHISNEIGFPNLTGTIDEKNLVAFFLEEMLQEHGEFAQKHRHYDESGEKWLKIGAILRFFYLSGKENMTYSVFYTQLFLTYSVFEHLFLLTYSVFYTQLFLTYSVFGVFFLSGGSRSKVAQRDRGAGHRGTEGQVQSLIVV